jgi:hypothetical protein
MAAAKLFNLARMTTPTAGTGATIALGVAVAGYLSFALSGVANGDVISYGIADGANSEVGTATYSSTGPQLTGRTVTKSTNGDAPIALSGSAQVFITIRSEDYVSRKGDTVNGNIVLDNVNPTIVLRKQASGETAQIYGTTTGNAMRWQMQLGNLDPESSGNAGSNFTLGRYSDAGALLDVPLTINRATAAMALTGDLTIGKVSPTFYLNSTAPGQNHITGRKGGIDRWTMQFGNNSAESGGNAGSDFALYRYDDAGGGAASALGINRATGVATFGSNLVVTSPGPYTSLQIKAPAGAGSPIVQGYKGGLVRWDFFMGDGSAESGSNVGSDFIMRAFRDDGINTINPFGITRSNGLVTCYYGLTVNGGDVRITKVQPSLILNKTSIAGAAIWGQYNGLNRWLIMPGAGDGESGSNAGSNFYITRYDDAGNVLSDVFSINRATGAATFNATGLFDVKRNAGGAAIARFTDDAADANAFIEVKGQYSAYIGSCGGYPGFFKDAGVTPAAWYDTNNSLWNVSGNIRCSGMFDLPGNIICGGQVVGGSMAVREATQPSLYLQGPAGSTTYVQIYHYIPNGRSGMIYNDPNKQFAMEYNGYVNLGTGMNSRAGVNGAFNTPTAAFNTCWTGGVLQVWVDATLMGNMSWTSDYRIKKDVIDLGSMWERVKALRPISYTQAQYTPQSEKVRKLEEALQARARELDVPQAKQGYEFAPMFNASDAEQWGFIAHEVQATLLPTAAAGVKDQADAIQSLNVGPIIAALTRALQESMSRIEQLEAMIAPLLAKPASH